MQPVPHTTIADARRDQRHMTVLLVAKVSGRRGEYACVVHDVSDRGLQARFPEPPMIGERMTFALRGLPAVAATVRWADGRRAGVEFDTPLDVATLVGPDTAALPPRPPRFRCGQSATLLLADRRSGIELIDVSLGGAKLGLSEPPPSDVLGRWATVTLPGHTQARAGTVCWTRDGRLGFRFATPLPLDLLAALLADAGR